MKIPWPDRKTNKEVLKLTGMQSVLIKVIRKGQMKFLGRIGRRNGSEVLYYVRKLEEEDICRCRILNAQ